MIFIPQHDKMDCGPACLAMVSNWYGKKYSLQYLRDNSFINRDGVSLLGISEASKKIGFETKSVRINKEDLQHQTLPCILHWNQNHFVVLYKIKKKPFSKNIIYKIADPAHGMISFNEASLFKSWVSSSNQGIALLLSPTDRFYENIPSTGKPLSIKFLFEYLKPYGKQLILMFLLLMVASGITFLMPFLTKNLIDKGVNGKNLPLITIILLAQVSLYVGTLTVTVFRNWLMLYIGNRINITIISEYIKKLLKLPIKFFDTKMMGDFNQRIQDHERIEVFLTSQSMLTFFSLLTFSAFLVVFAFYSLKILLTYLILTVLSIAWSLYFLKQRRILDYYRFKQKSENQEAIYEIINGVTELKLNQLEEYKRSKWEQIQQELYKINRRVLKLDQFQLNGFDFINQIKNIMVTYLSAHYVIEGKMTLGELMSVSFIIGQMNSPVTQLVSFFRSFQDARLSLERLNEVKSLADEERLDQVKLHHKELQKYEFYDTGIEITNLSFQYGASKSPYVLKNINIIIPPGKVTAIVGASGSGKTTLMKLLLKFYEPTNGVINFNGTNLNEISSTDLRSNCGVVMQDGFIFSDTIERNIITSDEEINLLKYENAIKTANIKGFIDSLPLGRSTKIGAAGNGISGGQKQRILIARAVYKNPHYMLLDEATSALDAENEKLIYERLNIFLKGKTVLVIAHRLSTVKNADQIIVLKNGQVAEYGNHQQLVTHRSEYFNLIKNQLDLGA